MTYKQRIIVLVGAAFLVLMWVYPPWLHYFPNSKSYRQPRSPRGYFFVADTQQGEYYQGSNLVMRIDFGRLAVQSIAVSLIAAAAFVAFRPKPDR